MARSDDNSTESSTESEPQYASRVRSDEYILGVKKAAFPTLFGIIAGVLSFLLTDPSEGDGLLIAMILILIQRFVYPRYNMLMGAKDFLHISFTTLLSWFITFTLLLNCC